MYFRIRSLAFRCVNFTQNDSISASNFTFFFKLKALKVQNRLKLKNSMQDIRFCSLFV